MKYLLSLSLLFFLFSCGPRDGMPEDERNYEKIPLDTVCLGFWSSDMYEFKSLNADTILNRLQLLDQKILGKSFSDSDNLVMYDSILRCIFSSRTVITNKTLLIDTVNSSLKTDPLVYSMSDSIFPRNIDWRKFVVNGDAFTYQEIDGEEISYTISPCVKKIFNSSGQHKIMRRGESMPSYAKGSTTFMDKVYVYDCIFELSVYVNYVHKGTFARKAEYYKLTFSDTAQLYSSVNREKEIR